ncbi:hypothetical protein [Breznakiella homolactica]|uniref:Uncharacterized protein n=1 Tax=Breznakiella homolactica TaxID=2798577 RepID=A0A7T8BDG9_9SPIR|nr:hypothetical protein [Breznakiella homolactica]QQO11253.1 hypothetical protein JFL75_10195 [Breznakiella homolactica]
MVYRKIAGGLLLGLILVCSLAGQAQEGSLILTNAAGGLYADDQTLWFSVPAGERIRLVLNGAESYRGNGPASITLRSDPGEETVYRLQAERRSALPDDAVLDARSFLIVIDKKPPASPGIRPFIDAEGLIRFTCTQETGARTAAYIDSGGSPEYIDDLGAAALPPLSYSAVVWAVDGAGNCSEPMPFFFDLPPVRVANPVSGEWANPQRLVIHNLNGRTVFWTSDGSDPLGEGGIPYTTPVLIEALGQVELRIAVCHEDGRIEEESVTYTVNPFASERRLEQDPFLKRLRSLEERDISDETSVPIIPEYTWSVGGRPVFPGGSDVRIRPQPLAYRSLPLHLSSGDGIYRFVFSVGKQTTENLPENTTAASPNMGSTVLRTVSGQVPAGTELPKLVYSGNSRVVCWSGNSRTIRYSLGAAPEWHTASAPVLIGPAAAVLRWIDTGNTAAGEPFAAEVDPVLQVPPPEDDSLIRGRFAYQYTASGNRNPFSDTEPGPGETVFASDLLPLSGPQLDGMSPDVSDGEDITWYFIGSGGNVIRSWHADRLAPEAPALAAPEEGAWVRGPAAVKVIPPSGDSDGVSYIIARTEDSSGNTDVLRGIDTLEIEGKKNEITAVRIEAFTEDSAGNISIVTTRTFILDPSTVYVSASVKGGPVRDGSRENPFESLDEALALAGRESRRLIRVSGAALLTGNAAVTGSFSVLGNFDSRWEPAETKTRLMPEPGASLVVSGGELTLSNLQIEGGNSPGPVFRIENRGTLVLSGVSAEHRGQFLTMSGESRLSLYQSSVLSTVSEERRLPVIAARGGTIEIAESGLSMDGSNGLLLEMENGNLSVLDSTVAGGTGQTGTLFLLTRVQGELKGSEFRCQSGDYASVLESSNSRLTVTDCRFSAAARDGIVVVLDNTAAVCRDSTFLLAASFVAKAMDIRGVFPTVSGCTFRFTGTAGRSEIFSAAPSAGNPLLPIPGLIGNNVFTGFTHILGNEYPLDSLRGFNRSFAPPGQDNTLSR